MQKFFSLILFFNIFAVPVLALQDTIVADEASVAPIELDIEKNIESEEITLDINEAEDSVLKGVAVKEQKIAEYLQKGLSINIDGQLIDEIKFGGAYHGFLSYDRFHDSSNGSVKYNIPVGDMYMLTKFADKKSELKLMINPARTVDGIDYIPGILQDIYFATKPTKNTRLLIGNSRTPIGVEGGQSQYTLLLAKRSQIARTYGNIRALGVKLTGDYKWADYNVGIYDSSRYFYDMFNGPEVTGWVNFKPMANLDSEKYGKMLIGTGYNYGKRYNDYSVWGTYIGYEYKKFMINAEYAFANGYNGLKNSRASSDGFYTTVAYRVTPKLELVGRYDLFNPNRDVRNNNRTEISTGFNYYMMGQNLKFVLNYVFKMYENDRNSDGLYFLTQFMI